MSDKKLSLNRRNVLFGIGGMGAAAALGGAGTMAFLNDKVTSANNVVTAGSLRLKMDWWQEYNQGIHGSGSSSGTHPHPRSNLPD